MVLQCSPHNFCKIPRISDIAKLTYSVALCKILSPQWYQRPRQFLHYVSVLIVRSVDWLQCQWQIQLTENWRITKVVWPTSLWRKHIKMTGISVLTSCLCLIYIYIYIFIWINLMYWIFFCLMKIHDDSNDFKRSVMTKKSSVVFIWSKNVLELIFI